MPVIDPAGLIEERVEAIRAYHRTTGIERAELDVSGGVDSAVMLGLLTRALGADQVTAVYSSIHSGDEFAVRAREAAVAAGARLVELDLTAVFDGLQADMLAALERAGYERADVVTRIGADPTVLGSLRSCLRAPVGRALNRFTGGGIRHGTGNECEDRFLRFYQKGGDGEVDTNPIAMLSKGEVFQLGGALGAPRSILEAVPSPDLHGIGSKHTDEDELHALTGVRWTYSKVDAHSGQYTSVGTIERASRFLDGAPELIGADEPDWGALVAAARAGPFAPLDEAETEGLLRSCRRLEATTRHKANPNCPALGERTELVRAGLLDDVLP